MKPLLSLGVLATLLACAAGAQAQLYKWVGPDGKVTYSDTPPPATAARIETKTLGNSSVNTAGMSYELAQAVKNHPVTLYTTPDCAPCNDGRSLLLQRGIPFVEKTVSSNRDVEQFRKISSDERLPLLVVGHNKEQGYESGAWSTALTAAGYPKASQLPPGYQQAPAEPLVREVILESSSTAPGSREKRQPSVAAPAPATGNAPPGFRF